MIFLIWYSASYSPFIERAIGLNMGPTVGAAVEQSTKRCIERSFESLSREIQTPFLLWKDTYIVMTRITTIAVQIPDIFLESTLYFPELLQRKTKKALSRETVWGSVGPVSRISKLKNHVSDSQMFATSTLSSIKGSKEVCFNLVLSLWACLSEEKLYLEDKESKKV